MARKLTVVLSQAQGKNPAKRALEEQVTADLIMEPGVELSVIPHLYDLHDDHTGLLYLRAVRGDMVVLSWLYPRAAHWMLDRQDVKGHMGTTLLPKPEEEDLEDEAAADEKPQGVGGRGVPDRRIYHLDLRDHDSARPYAEEVRRIARDCRVQTVPLTSWIQSQAAAREPEADDRPRPPAEELLQPVERRWYPVIDYSRCTNCMECIDFCLFGVYGVDGSGRILVEEQDNCKRGCPACSRVCPVNAIVFPEHKTPAIAGGDLGGIAGLKIDLSKLFGAASALEVAAQERDVELVRDGRSAVGMAVGIPKRQAGKPEGPKDALDHLMDSLDALDL